MNQTAARNVNARSRVASTLMAEKKKVIIAAVLIALMLFMWGKLLLKGKTAKAAKAAPSVVTDITAGQAQSHTTVSPVTLPRIPGRHDVLARDVFAGLGWQKIRKDGENLNVADGVNVVEANDGDVDSQTDDILRYAQTLKLHVIAAGKMPQAFINDALLTVGATIIPDADQLGRGYRDDGQAVYEFKVVKITENEVILVCQGVRIEMQMQPTYENDR